MAENRVDPVYEYVDAKIDLLKKEVLEIVRVNDSLALQQAGLVLQSHRRLAIFMVTTTHYLSSLTPGVSQDAFHQLGLTASATIAKIETANDPLLLANEFRKAFLETLERSGIRLDRLS